jgi:multidrug resistance efflux pump
MSNGRTVNPSRIIIVNVIVLLLLIGGGFAVYYYYNQSYYYVSTDNARIDGQLITISALGNGKITDWTASVGNQYSTNQRLGGLLTTGLTGTSAEPTTVDITMPAKGTIVQQNILPNSFVAAGTPLAYAYNMNNLWVSANVNETNISNIQQNQAADIYIDAYPGTVLSGKVSQIGLTTAAQFSLLPQQNTTANYTKVTQVIPVIITLDGYKGLNLDPGMSVTARIHIR